jgi:hypothetical protein
MRHNKHTHDQKQTTEPAPLSASSSATSQKIADFTPSADEVARRAYFTYVNQGSSPGHDVQHWLAAEAELTAERNQTRIHGFHNQT